MTNESSLVTRIMKEKYFPSSDFLHAKLGANPSYMWRSIVEAQEILNQGVRRRIGDGHSTNIWNSPWLPCENNDFLTSTRYYELEDVNVVNLMKEGGGQWDESVLHDILNERDVQLIKKIPIPIVPRSDSWFWLLDDSGKFIVKSCYRRLYGEQTWDNATFWRKL